MDVFNQVKKTPTPGRKKIEIKELDKDSSKLCVLCNTQLAIIVFSPTDKPFCFGQPKVEVVLRRYMAGNSQYVSSETFPVVEDNSLAYGELNKKYEEATRVLELERKRIEEIENLAKVWDRGNWWDQPIGEMNVEQLEQYLITMQELWRKLAEREDELRGRFVALTYGANTFGAVNFTGFLNQFGGKKFGF